jgi:energy-converting hydrogenase Eha subunit B
VAVSYDGNRLSSVKNGVVRKQYLHRDHLASVRAVTDSKGNVVEATTYAAYGEPTNGVMKTEKSYIGNRLIARPCTEDTAFVKALPVEER